MTDSETKSKSSKKSTARIVGGLIFAAAVAAVFLMDRTPEEEEEAPVVRPLKTMVIESSFAAKGKTYPGKVSAGQQVNMAFEVPGLIVERAVNRGDNVSQGQVLMRLDPRDFENDYNSALAERDRARAQLERMEQAARSNAVSKQEVDDARAAFDQAAAAVDTRKKALEDTKLSAKFDGVIGDTFVQQFQNVQAKQQVLSLIDISTIEIDVSVSEGDVARARPENRDKIDLVATFDFFPGEVFPVKIAEVTTEADPVTQTYTITVAMDRPEDKNILPGMTATVTARIPRELLREGEDGFPVPLDAVPVDGLGQYYVWKLKETGEGSYTVHRADVEVGEVDGDDIVVVGGLAKGDRIALAGVHVLTEGREVRLLESRSDPSTAGASSGETGRGAVASQ